MIKVVDYFDENKILIDSCNIVSYEHMEESFTFDLQYSYGYFKLNLILTNDIIDILKNINIGLAVKVYEDDKKIYEGVIKKNNTFNLFFEETTLNIDNILSLLTFEILDTFYKNLINEGIINPIYDFSKYSILNILANEVNKYYPDHLKIFKVNSNLSEVSTRNTRTFFLKKGDYVEEVLKKLLKEFHKILSWNEGFVLQDLRKILNSKNIKELNCLDNDSVVLESIVPDKNKLNIKFTSKDHSKIEVLMRDGLKDLYTKININKTIETLKNQNKNELNKELVNPIANMFEGDYYPENSNEYKNEIEIKKGFLNSSGLIKTNNKLIITGRDLNTEIDPIILIDDVFILFNPYNEFFKKVSSTKNIMSKSEFYKKYNIQKDDVLYSDLEKLFETKEYIYEPTKPKNFYLMLNEFNTNFNTLYFSFKATTKASPDEKKDFKPLYIISVFGSAHYRDIFYSLEGILNKNLNYIEENKTKEEFLYYINDKTDAIKYYLLEQSILISGYNILTFSTNEDLTLNKKYKIKTNIIKNIKDLNEEKEITYNIILKKKIINFFSNGYKEYTYEGLVMFNILKEEDLPYAITSKILKETKTKFPYLLKNIWDDNIKYTEYQHNYLDYFFWLSFTKHYKEKTTLVIYNGLYYIHSHFNDKNYDRYLSLFISLQGNNNIEIVLAEKEFKLKALFKKNVIDSRFKIYDITGINSKKYTKKNIIKGGFVGQKHIVDDGIIDFAKPYKVRYV